MFGRLKNYWRKWRPTRATGLIEPTRDLVLKKLRDCFPDTRQSADALAILDTYGAGPDHPGRERVQLAMLMASEGRLERLQQLADLANNDFRDVLVKAEYPEQFRAPFNISAEEKSALCKRDRERCESWLKSSDGAIMQPKGLRTLD